ncbi:uncharacterized protein LOC132751874 [Ruditapes philippinarum]|uniref:uncharacterized protein LOC132751874 n=1 Tax=Ruditapes philippinarum TaxID=129788 RepID=UPI00295B57DF|nr:uncharacterized protein LOC132751874 [Ruditapes philippinarum]
MKSVYSVFNRNKDNDDDFIRNIKQFKELFKDDNLLHCTFHEFQSLLESISNRADKLNEVTVSVMTVLGESFNLLQFLADIADADIRTLIDAVEYISEQHIQGRTVSALNEVKRFVHPLLVYLGNEKLNIDKLFETIETQIMNLGTYAKELHLKIDDCNRNFHNLKSLYNRVCNRGEQTKEVVSNFIRKSKVKFVIFKEERQVCFYSIYEDETAKSGVKIIKKKDESTLIDYRSRALLLKNAEWNTQTYSFNREDRAELELFINSINLCMDIKDILSQLLVLGHILYTGNELDENVSELQQLKCNLETKLSEWSNELENERNRFYLLNFVQGFEIHALYDFLRNGKGGYTAETILKSIHPLIKADKKIRNIYDKVEIENRLVIRNIGHVLHTAHQGIKRFTRSFPIEASTSRMSDIVHKGHVRIINVGDQARSVFQTVLALYRNTTQTLPETHQLLICRRSTRWEEVHLLLARCFGAYTFYDETPLFCLVSVENLERSIQDKLAQAINNVSAEDNFLLSIICKRSKNLFEMNKRDEMETVRPLTDEETRVILRKIEPNVCTYSSELAGLGKTSTIYQTSLSNSLTTRTLHISGPFSRRKGIEMLQNMRMKSNQVLHLDISLVSKPDELDLFLSELILLQYISDDKGSFFLNTKHIAIEIANSINNELIDSLTIATLFQRKHLTFDSYQSFTPSLEINSPLQVVCHYLRRLKLKETDKNEIHFSRHANIQPISTDECRGLLENAYPLTKDTSFNTIYIFLNVLSDQLKRLSASPFFRNIHIADMIGDKRDNNIRSTVVEMMMNTAKEFSTRSVATCRYLQVSSKEKLQSSDYSVKRTDEMIQWQSSNHLIFYLHHDARSVNVLYRDISKVRFQLREFFENQMNEKLNDYMKMSQEELREVVQKVGHGMSHESQELPEDYVLTPDNVLKMVITLMRINAQVPVLLMGETGCGKTTLVKYLSLICKIPFSELRIHAGLASEEIEKTVFFMHKKCCEDHTLQRWLFLDEVNTTEHIGMISDIICHKQCNGTILAPNLVIIGACNPYKMKSESQMKATGLKGKLKFDSLSKLVYRVHPLTESMLDYVWDFGYLSDTDERMYIQRMTNDVFTKEKSNLLTELIASSQKFVRESEKSEFAVSLRDVYRCKVLIKWFTGIIPQKQVSLKMDKVQILENATILSLTHCYHCRFSGRNQRTDYRKMLASVFLQYNYPSFTEEYIYDVMKTEQNDILERMNVPAGIAKNTALRENVFMLFVCILNKIPIFLVGKPGCSKSLAIQLIRSNLRGEDSTDPFFKTLPQLYCVSFQGTESSTSDGIKKVFEKAEQYQKTFTDDNILSVVILDEIGLAEISQFNPLKILHNLLEPARGGLPNVAVVGISNWALDASKMNRAVHVSRPDMDIDELKETGISISESLTKDVEKCQSLQVPINDVNLTKNMEILLHNIAKSYKSYTKTLKFKSFFGLRDFYALVKFVTRAFAKGRFTLSSREEAGVILEGLQRNFGGLPAERGTLMFHFRDCFRCELPKMKTISDLISDNVIDISARHLMLITKSDSMIASLESILNKSGRKNTELIFGSHFEEDLTDDYNYRILNRIIMCMEQGVVLILKNLEKIYGSLYDMLNQNYTRIGKHNSYCRVALGPYSNPFAYVFDSFRCIVIVDERKLDYADPPFLNRFEKQYITYDNLLSKDDKDVATELDNWLDNMCTIIGKSFEKKDILPIYNNALMKTLVLKQRRLTSKTKYFKSRCKEEMLWLFRPEAIVRLSKAVDIDIQHQSDKINKEYFALPIHEGIAKYVEFERDQILDENHLNRSIVFTYSNISSKVEHYFSKWDIQFEKLQTFKSEKQLRAKIQSFWESSSSEILFLQCSGKEDASNIMLCKNIMERYSSEWIEKKSSSIKKHIYLVIHLVGEDSSVLEEINFLSGWKMVMMDSLEPDLLYLCKTSLLKVIENKQPLSPILKKELFWAFTKIRYGSSGRQNEEIGNLVDMLKKSNPFLFCLEKRIFADIKNRCKDAINFKWQTQVASDVTALKTSTNFTEALNRFILDAIKHPLSKFIFLLESKGALHSYFAKDDYQCDRQRLWEYLFESDRIVSIAELQDGFGPCCYICERVHRSLSMPFSQVIFETIEAKRDYFIEDMSKLRSQSEIHDDDILPDDVMNELVYQLEHYIFGTIPYIQKLEYRNMKEDYISDFCTLVSFTAGVTANSDANQMSMQYMKWAIQKKMSCKSDYSDVFARLHITFWTNQNMFRAILQFLDASYSEADHMFFMSLIEDDNSLQSESSKLSTSEETNFSVATGSDEFDGDLNSPDPFYQFLAESCRYYIPSTTYLLKQGDLSLWHFRLKTIFAIAPYISPEPHLLFVLRFCDDVFLHLNDKMPKDILGRLGDILTTNRLDSESTSETISTLFQIEEDYVRRYQLECTSTEKRHVIISQYLIRCLQTNSQTLVYCFLFDLIQQSTIPDSQIGHFRCPLFIFLQLENTDYGLSNLVVPGEKWNSYSGAKINESERNFLSLLDKCLIQELRKRGDSPFCILITDLLKRIFLEIEDKEYPQLILDCVSTLQVEVGGLKSVASFSFLKTAISKLPSIFDEYSEVNQEIINSLDLMFVGLAEKDICNTLKVYLLKEISFNVPQYEVIIRLKRYAQKIKSIGHINLNDKSINNTLDMNPLAVFFTEHSKRDIQLLLKEKPHTLTFEYLISIMSSLIHIFFLKTLRGSLTDTEKRKKDETLKEIQHMKFSDKYFVVVEALLDRSRMITKSFTLTEGKQISSKEYFQLLVIGSLYALSVSNPEEEKIFMTKCLTNPCSLASCYIPGFLDKMRQKQRQLFPYHTNIPDVIFSECRSCELRLAFNEKATTYVCPVCNQTVQSELKSKNLPGASNFIETKGFVQDNHDDDVFTRIRNISPLSKHILQFLIKCNILGSFTLRFCAKDNFISACKLEKTDCSNLHEQIKAHWKHISTMINCDDFYVSSFLLHIMHRSQNLLFFPHSNLETPNERKIFESKFEKIVQDIIKNGSKGMLDFIRSYKELPEISTDCIEFQIREADDISTMDTRKRIETLPGLFRKEIPPDTSHLLYKLKQENSHHFLQLVITDNFLLTLPKHIYNLIQWHMITVANTCYMMKSYECSSVKVINFLDSFKEMRNQQVVKKRFEAFRDSWNELSDISKHTDILPKISHINSQSILSECLVIDEHSLLFEILSSLVNIQNNVLDYALALKFNSSNLDMLWRGNNVAAVHTISVTDTRQCHFIDMTTELADAMDNWAYSELGYGTVGNVIYDFDHIEQEVVAKILVGKLHLNIDTLPKIIFIDHMYRQFSALVEDIRLSTKQEPLPLDTETLIIESIQKSNTSALNLIHYLDMLMTLLRKTKLTTEGMTLVDFAEKKSSIICRPFPKECLPNPESCVKISHIISLHELLEEKCAFPLLDGLAERFCIPLEPDMKQHFEKMPCNDIAQAEITVKAIKLFVYRCMSMNRLEPDQQLLTYLSDASFWPPSMYILEDKRKIELLIPQNVMVSHVRDIVFILTDEIRVRD